MSVQIFKVPARPRLSFNFTGPNQKRVSRNVRVITCILEYDEAVWTAEPRVRFEELCFYRSAAQLSACQLRRMTLTRT
jgi:hypothetical protein